MTGRRVSRVAAEAAFIVVIALLAWVADIPTPGIVVAVLVAWLLAACAEVVGSRAEDRVRTAADVAIRARVNAPHRPGSGPPAREVVARARPLSAPVVGDPDDDADRPGGGPRFGRLPRVRHEAPPEPPPTVRWNLWELEKLARDRALDPMRELELSALLVHLRDYAAADGLLPTEFDPLVRESFGDLLATIS